MDLRKDPDRMGVMEDWLLIGTKAGKGVKNAETLRSRFRPLGGDAGWEQIPRVLRIVYVWVKSSDGLGIWGLWRMRRRRSG